MGRVYGCGRGGEMVVAWWWPFGLGGGLRGSR